MATTRVFISEVLIVSQTHRPGGTGGVYRWASRVAAKTKRVAEATAPVGNPLDHLLIPYVPGCYKRGFKMDRLGSNGAQLRAVVYNTCPHSLFAEKGRRPSRKWERYTWAKRGGAVIVAKEGTRGFAGSHTLENALESVAAGAMGRHVKSEFVRPGPL